MSLIKHYRQTLKAGFIAASVACTASAAIAEGEHVHVSTNNLPDETTQFWVEELRWLQNAYGLQMNPDRRKDHILHNRAPAWSQGHDFENDDIVIAPSLRGTAAEQEFRGAIDSLGAARNLMFNSGISHVLLLGSFREEMRSSSLDMLGFDDEELEKFAGLYIHWNNQAFTSYSMVPLDYISLEHVAKHEAGHAFSENISPQTYLKHTLGRDYDNLTPEQSKSLSQDLRTSLRALFRKSSWNHDTEIALYFSRKLAQTFGNEPDAAALFPQTVTALSILDVENMNADSFYRGLDAHERIKLASTRDIYDLFEGNSPNSARLVMNTSDINGITKDRLFLIAENPNDNSEIKIIMHSYFLEFHKKEKRLRDLTPEAFAEVFATAHDGCDVTEICYYFPRLNTEIQGVVSAIEILAAEERSAAMPNPAIEIQSTQPD